MRSSDVEGATCTASAIARLVRRASFCNSRTIAVSSSLNASIQPPVEIVGAVLLLAGIAIAALGAHPPPEPAASLAEGAISSAATTPGA
jgi:hypothetical protein